MRPGLMGLALLIASCDPGGESGPDSAPNPCETEDRADAYLPGMSVSGDNGTVVVLRTSVPAPPAKGDNTWDVVVELPDGGDTSNLQLEVMPIMPDHGHGTAVTTIVEPGDDPGSYILDPVNLTMAGYWETTVSISDASGAPVDDVVFRFCVEP